jgi:hypothetical protein
MSSPEITEYLSSAFLGFLMGPTVLPAVCPQYSFSATKAVDVAHVDPDLVIVPFGRINQELHMAFA